MTEQRFGIGDYPDPDTLPEPLRRLHRKQMRAIRAARKTKAKDVDETGRAWRGLVKPRTTQGES